MKIPQLATFLFLTLSSASFGAHPYLPNGDFDSDINGWIPPPQPDTAVAWDAFGHPGGSLVLSSTYVPGDDETAVRVLSSHCITEPFGSYEISGEVYSPSSAPRNCQIDLLGFESSDCTGEFLIPVFNGNTTADEWVFLQGNGTNVSSSGVVRSARVSLMMYRPGDDALGVCYFDNVDLSGPLPIPGIPALGPAGAVALIGLLAVFAIAALRR